MTAHGTGTALALIMLAALGSGSALGATAKSTVKITHASGTNSGGVEVRGVVTSKKSDCIKLRRVKAYHDVAPPGPSPNDFLFGEGVTNAKGRWRASTEFAPDKVYVRVVKRKVGTLTCAATKSTTVNVEFD